MHMDASHVCLVKNWVTFQRMKASEEEVEHYLLSTAKSVADELVRKYAGLLETDSTSLEKYKELQLFPKDLKNFKG
jgi:hypothetical protein